MPNDDIDAALREMLPLLRRFARWLARDPHGADDLVQATMERAILKWSTRRERESLRAWLFSILHRQFLDARRRSRRYAWLLTRTESEEEEYPSAEREVVARSTLEALDRLPHEQRVLLLCVSVEGLSYQEIAEVLEVPVGTVMSRLSRARQALRRLIDVDSPAPALRLLK